MSAKSPLFSIVMPTRNRAALLEYALRSAVQQTFTNYEIVVSDNHSEHHTREIVQGFRSDRLRYVRTPRVLSMPDSWEFALAQAHGEYITFLCDDDAMLAGALKETHDVIEMHGARIVSWRELIYLDEPWNDKNKHNQLIIIPFSGEIVIRSSQVELEKLFRLQDDIGIPKMLNSCCHKDVISTIKKRQGRFFLPVAPDYSSCAAMLATNERYVYIDRPLMITGLVSLSKSEESMHRFVQEFNEKELFRHVPLAAHIGRNGIAETLLRVKESMPDEFRYFELDWIEYFSQYLDELTAFREKGVDTGSTLEEFYKVLRQQPAMTRIRFRTRRISKGIMAASNNAMRGTVLRSSLLLWWKAKLKRQYFGRTVVIEGDQVGFRNVWDCVQMWPILEKKIRNP